LFFIVIKKEIEWIFGTIVDQHHVGIIHSELAEAQLSAAKCHIVSAALVKGLRLCFRTKDHHQLVALYLDIAQLPSDLRRREQLFGVENQIVSLNSHSANLLGVDEFLYLYSQQVHQPLNRQMSSLDFLCLDAHFSIRSRAQRALSFERHVSFGIKFPLDF